MPIHYVLSEKGNPLNLLAPKKWYANAKSTGEISLKALGKQITQRCTVKDKKDHFPPRRRAENHAQ